VTLYLTIMHLYRRLHALPDEPVAESAFGVRIPRRVPHYEPNIVPLLTRHLKEPRMFPSNLRPRTGRLWMRPND